MAQISIPKNYADGTPLFESDLDDIRNGTTDFINVTKLNDDNLQAGGISGDKLNSTVADDSTLEFVSNTMRIKDAGVTEAKIALANRYMPIGSVTMFHTFNAAVSIPRGWMICNGDVVNTSNYEAIHGVGTFATDGVGSAALNAKNLPDLTDKYAVGVASTTQDGSVAITAVGNTDHEVDLEHNHKWYDFVTSATDSLSWDASGASNAMNTTGTRTAGNQMGASHSGDTVNYAEDFWTENAGSTTQDVQPESIELIYIIKVV